MQNFLTSLYVKVRVFRESNGQDLIEYALVAALIALAATAGMSSVPTSTNLAFSTVGTTLTSYT